MNGAVTELVGADSAGFLLPGVDAAPMYSAEHPAENMAAFPELTPPNLLDGTPIWLVGLRKQVTSMTTAYEAELPRYLASEYYNTFAAPNGAAFTASIIAPLAPVIAEVGPNSGVPGAATALQLWRDRRGREYDERSLATLRLLLPSFRSGVDAARRRDPFGSTWRVIDELGQAVVAVDTKGRFAHCTGGFERLLAREPQQAPLLDGIRALASDVRRQLRTGRPARTERTLRTPTTRYQVTVAIAPGAPPSESMLLAAVTPCALVSRTDDDLRTRYGLTLAEIRVARLIAEGLSSPQIGKQLAVSVHTIRRQTEAVYRKLSISSRAALPALLVE